MMRHRKARSAYALILCAAALAFALLPALADGARAEETVFVLDSCDDASQATTSKQADRSNFVEGTGSLYSNNEAGRITLELRGLDHSKLPAFNEAYLEFYYYVEDVFNIGAGQVELNSSGYEDVEEINLDLSAQSGLRQGWNFVSIKLSQMRGTGGFNYKKLCGFRIFMTPSRSDSFVCRLDALTISNVSHKAEVEAAGIVPQSLPPVRLEQVRSENTNRGA